MNLLQQHQHQYQLPQSSPTAIRVEGLTKRFGDLEALAGIDFEVPTGSVLGVLGPNGAGKTTTVRILTTVITADGGSASVLGLDVARQADAVRARIGLAGQYAAVDGNLTGRENLRLIGRLTHLGRTRATRRADELLERFGLADAADRTARTYSGGMRRRLDLAAALVHQPPVLFLDEPTTGLDPHGRSNLWEVIEELAADGTTVLLTTQYLEEADRLADDIILINDGRIIAEGTPTELKAQLGSTVIEVGLGDDYSAARATEVVAPFGVRSPARSGRTVQLEVADGARTLVQALRALDQNGLETLELNVREPSLDDVFLSLTGDRRDRDDEIPRASRSASQTETEPVATRGAA
jgi:daunorubicin resistance ABC transporter ATP-binding subunit